MSQQAKPKRVPVLQWPVFPWKRWRGLLPLALLACALMACGACVHAQLPEGIEWHRVAPNIYVGRAPNGWTCAAQVDDTGEVTDLLCRMPKAEQSE